jgi:hypothetical protein
MPIQLAPAPGVQGSFDGHMDLLKNGFQAFNLDGVMCLLTWTTAGLAVDATSTSSSDSLPQTGFSAHLRDLLHTMDVGYVAVGPPLGQTCGAGLPGAGRSTRLTGIVLRSSMEPPDCPPLA